MTQTHVRGRRWLCPLLALPLAACAADPDGAGDFEETAQVEATAQVALPIVDPTPAGPSDLLAMVKVSSSQGSCSGMVIAADTILTAAHCFCEEGYVGGNACSTAATVTFRPDPATPGARPRVLSGVANIHPDYNPSWTERHVEHDVAVIKLNGVAPAHVKPFIVANDYPDEGSRVTIAGFGKSGADCSTPFGTLNFDAAVVGGYEDGHDILRFNDRVFCSGDSGGAILNVEASRAYAVHSMRTWTLTHGWVSKGVTTGSEFDWIKSAMCPSSRWNQCSGHGDTCSCSASTNLLWRHANGQVAIWFMDGGDIVGEAYPGGQDPGLTWQIQGSGDFDGDGQSDVLWRHANGQVAIWFMDGGAVAGQGYPGGQDPSLFWKVQGVGDFDGDGRSDILWRDGSGQLAIWFTGDAAQAAYPGYHNYPAPVDNSWQVQGVGDFDGDERSDILWRNTSGQVAIWFMSGGTRVGEAYPGGQDPSLFWKVQAIGDFDGNLRSDILWRDGSGQLAIWFGGEQGFDSPSYNNAQGPGDLSWQVQGVGDFDHDRRDDIVWRNTNGQVAIWLMHGAHFVGDLYPRQVDNSWAIKGLLHDAGR
ncbi:FG-GAP-like repeat-containing protein [Sorangium sp. So ce1078]|uniref:FG-GAP-like repeat-containing protein n=1 Tax=Sorangium sp. So ce1078 TaxID=3133329 RepID=UPI003F5D6351